MSGATGLRQAKTKYLNDLFCEMKATKLYWNLVKKATVTKRQTVVGPLKTEPGHLVVKDDNKACLRNTYFASIGEKLVHELLPSIMPLVSSDLLLQSSSVPSLSDVKLTEDSVLRLIKQMKATGPNGISPKTIELHQPQSESPPYKSL